jgi:hypothetical protein
MPDFVSDIASDILDRSFFNVLRARLLYFILKAADLSLSESSRTPVALGANKSQY